jgi:hypothetical protein
MDLDARIRRLEDLEAIQRLKHRYWRCLDLKLWDDLAGCFTDDATADYGEGRYRFAGAEAILGFLRGALGEASGSVTVHHGHHPEIELTGATTARGTWALYNYLFNVAQKRSVRIGAYYDDRYVKLAGGWKIAHTGYTYIFREEWNRDDTPSLTLVAP